MVRSCPAALPRSLLPDLRGRPAPACGGGCRAHATGASWLVRLVRLGLHALAILGAGAALAQVPAPGADPAAPLPPLPPAVVQALERAGLPPQALAVAALPLARPLDAGWLHQGERVMQPGSTMKLVTSIVALHQLGPNVRSFTELRSAAPLEQGVLRGDLVLRGGADPELGVAAFWALLMELRQAGVQRIDGDLVVDRTRWRPARPDLGVPPFDEAPEFPYNVIPDALQLAGALLPLQLQATAAGTVQAQTVPPLAGLELRSRMTLVPGECRDWDDHWQPARSWREGERTVVELQGGFPRGCSQRAELQLIDRQDLTERLFRTLWAQLGGQWNGRAREAAGPADSRLLVRRTSRPWGELLRQLNKVSDNALTRTLFLELGVPDMERHPQATTAELADRAVRRWLAEHGIAADGLVMDNGSGLSRQERIRPLQLAQMLRAAHAAPYAADLLMSLPTVGVDGTMRNRLRDSPATGWARLKTGTLRNVVALAGYLRDPGGQPWAVAMMINHDRAGQGRPVLDALVDHMARHGPQALIAAALPPPAPPPTVGPRAEGP